MPTVEKDVEVGWARSGQAAAERAEAEGLLRETAQAFDAGDYPTAADILHGLREGGFAYGETADRLVERIRSSLGDSDRACFERTLTTGLRPKPERGADGIGESGGTTGRQPAGAGPWTVSVLAGWLAASAIFAATGAPDDSFVVIPWMTWFLVFLGASSVPALVVWLVGYAFMRRAERGHDHGRP